MGRFVRVVQKGISEFQTMSKFKFKKSVKKSSLTEGCWVKWLPDGPIFGGSTPGLRYVVLGRVKSSPDYNLWQVNCAGDKETAKEIAKHAYKTYKKHNKHKIIVEVWKNGKCVYRLKAKE